MVQSGFYERHAAVNDFLGNAYALLFPIDWPEPFGLVMIEAMACGTPVIAFPCGSVPEIVDPGVTGFLVESVDEAVQAVKEISLLSRRGCRQTFEKRFSVQRMAEDYVAIYRSILQSAEAPGDMLSQLVNRMSTTDRLNGIS